MARLSAAVYLFAALAVAACTRALVDHEDSDDDVRRDHPSRAPVHGDRATPPPSDQHWNEIMPNKCTDPISGKKYKIGVTWYPEGCGRRTCFYSTEHDKAMVHTEKCSCKGCPVGMQCSVVERVLATDARYPQCCPTTVCVPGRSLWSYFKNDYFKNAFSKLQKAHR